MRRIWDLFLLNDELDMLQCRLEEISRHVHRHVLVESPVTHRGVPKPLHYQENRDRFAHWQDKIAHVIADPPEGLTPWEREHYQRHQAWPAIAGEVEDRDTVLLCDVDEIPSLAALLWTGDTAADLLMRTAMFAVDWELPGTLQAQASVAVRGKWLREQVAAGRTLGDVRDARSTYQRFGNGGWHLSWLGGVDAQTRKLETATCHTEIGGTREADLIRSGARYREADKDAGGGIELVAAEVDSSWPRYIRERRCPDSWFRPRIGVDACETAVEQ